MKRLMTSSMWASACLVTVLALVAANSQTAIAACYKLTGGEECDIEDDDCAVGCQTACGGEDVVAQTIYSGCQQASPPEGDLCSCTSVEDAPCAYEYECRARTSEQCPQGKYICFAYQLNPTAAGSVSSFGGMPGCTED